MRDARALLIAGVLGVGSLAWGRPWEPTQPVREGRPPRDVIRADVTVRVAPDDAREERGRFERSRDSSPSSAPSAATGMQRDSHFAPPLRTDVALRVLGGDSPDKLRKPSAKPTALDGSAQPPPSAEALAHLPIRSEIALRLPKGDDPEGDAAAHATSATTGAQSRPRGTASDGGAGALAAILRCMAVQPPSWMLTRLMNGEHFVQFDDPKLDRLGTRSAAARLHDRARSR